EDFRLARATERRKRCSTRSVGTRESSRRGRVIVFAGLSVSNSSMSSSSPNPTSQQVTLPPQIPSHGHRTNGRAVRQWFPPITFQPGGNPMAINVKKVVLFLGLTFALTYLLAIVYFQAGGIVESPDILIFGVTYMFMPALCAVVVQKLVYKAPLKEPLRINFRPNRWFLIAWLLPLLIAVATFGVALLFPGVTFSPDKQDNFRYLLLKPKHLGIEIATNRFAWAVFLTLLQGLVTGITVNALAGFGEELGWRGFLQRELGALGFWKASAIIGFAWGFWHAPLIIQG